MECPLGGLISFAMTLTVVMNKQLRLMNTMSTYRTMKNKVLLLAGICLLMVSSATSAERPFHYQPEGNSFVCINGDARFTRALYGGPTAFRLETSDRPEFALWLPGMGGNITFFLDTPQGRIDLDKTSYVCSRYTAGKRTYLIKLNPEGEGLVLIEALAGLDAEDALWKMEAFELPRGTRLGMRFGGASGKHFARNGDMGVDPDDCFDLKPDYCKGNAYSLKGSTFTVRFAQDSKQGEQTLYGCLPDGAQLTLDYIEPQCPVLTATWKVSKEPCYVCIGREPVEPYKRLAHRFADTDAAREALASRIVFKTPDEYLNPLGGALTVAADGIWDGKTWQHGAVGWRMPLTGWRAAYAGDCLGWHDRARAHFNAYAASQVTDVEPTIPHPSQDAALNMARAEKQWGTQMYSNGYICRNPESNDQMHHYDMNLCYVDELLWHLQWTGDLQYAAEIFPVIENSLAWEKRNFDPDDDGLYDAYCCIWASDGLYYSGGAVTHSSAMNLRANRLAAVLAEALGMKEKAASYHAEARKTADALASVLWNDEQGVWAECRDRMGYARQHPYPALWTVYHAIDSEVGTSAQRYSATQYVDREIPHIPVTDDLHTLSTSMWQPYGWSINNVAFAEVMNMALAYWEVGRYEEGYRLLQASVVDGMYMGNSPGNFGQISYYDAARHEAYRDSGDPIGVASRAFIEGLYGVVPDRLNDQILLRPGFPADWNDASLVTPDIRYDFRRKGTTDTYTIHLSEHFRAELLMLRLRARYDYLVSATVNGQGASWQPVPDAVGCPMVEIPVFTDGKGDFEISVRWAGSPLDLSLSAGDDFEPAQQGQMMWTRPARVREATPFNPGTIEMGDFEEVLSGQLEQVRFDVLLNDSVTNIFRPRYLSPRPPYTTLQIPVTGIGEWCHPQVDFKVDDTAMREGDVFHSAVGVPFRTPAKGNNIVFTSLWDNFPAQTVIPLWGRATHAYLLMAGTTNAMQSRVDNAVLRVRYVDGTVDSLLLVNPETWCPMEQDYYCDGLAFPLRAPRPRRVMLSSGLISTVPSEVLTADGNEMPSVSETSAIDTNSTGLFGNTLPGGAGQLLDLHLQPRKELLCLELETLSNDIVVGIMAVTLQR